VQADAAAEEAPSNPPPTARGPRIARKPSRRADRAAVPEVPAEPAADDQPPPGFLPRRTSYIADAGWTEEEEWEPIDDDIGNRITNEPAEVKGARRNPAVNMDDDDWQPTSATAHLEGITRSMRKDSRQQRDGGTPGFAAKVGVPRDPNAPARPRKAKPFGAPRGKRAGTGVPGFGGGILGGAGPNPGGKGGKRGGRRRPPGGKNRP
jgi:hypothetical protein